jgi:ketosteroid isomerase-like protein
MSEALAADRRFFAALLAADLDGLDALLADDFVLVDVLSGGEVSKPALIAALASGDLRFVSIAPAEVRVRSFGATSIVNGRTEMQMSFQGAPLSARSRYTHVFVDGRLVSAQGTPIAGP